MKKIVCLVLAMLLFATTAMAAVTSKTTADLIHVDVTIENATEEREETPYIAPVVLPENEEDMTPEEKAVAEVVNTEYDKLTATAQTTKVETYFGNVKDETGADVDLREMLGAEENEELNVHEFGPVTAGGFTVEDGKATAALSFATQYEENTEVVVMIGLVAEDGTVAWQAFKGVAMETGAIKVTFPAEVLVAIQSGTALMAIVSK